MKSLEQIENADDSKTFIIHIADDLVFSDGSAIESKHYAAAIALFAHPTLIALDSRSTEYEYFTGGTAYKNGETDVFAGLRLPDRHTLSLTVNAAYVPYFYDLAFLNVMPLSLDMWLGEGYDLVDDGDGVHFLGDMSVAALSGKIEDARVRSEGRITAGPYVLTGYDREAGRATLEINRAYKGNFSGQKPHIQRIVIVGDDQSSVLEQLGSGTTGVVANLLQKNSINKANELAAAGGIKVLQYPRNGYSKLLFKCDRGPTQFTAVRQAIAHLLDRAAFADTITGGYGSVVHGPYGLAMWMYQQSKAKLESLLDTYAHDPAVARTLLAEDGWIYDALGNPYTEGIRHKKVDAAEAGQYEHNITLPDGTVLMPLIIEWAAIADNTISDLLVTMLVNNANTAAAGMAIHQTSMPFSDVISRMNENSNGDPAIAGPSFGMFNLGTDFPPIYDMSFAFTGDPAKLAQGHNVNRLVDAELDRLSMDMVFGVRPNEADRFLDLWIRYIDRWNELLPDLPLFSNSIQTAFSDKLKGYDESSFFKFDQAIVYARLDG